MENPDILEILGHFLKKKKNIISGIIIVLNTEVMAIKIETYH